MNNSKLEELIAAWLDGRIGDADSELLQQQLRESDDARAAFRSYAKLDAAIHRLAGSEVDFNFPHGKIPGPHQSFRGSSPKVHWKIAAFWISLACAACLFLLVGGLAYQIGRDGFMLAPIEVVKMVQPETASEKTIAGYATLRRVAGIQWPEGANSFREGDVLPAGVLEFEAGVAEIDFFCGATVIVEGPAKMDLESDWSVRFLAGRLRAHVPPAARGFVVKAADSEIIDLGTEFALEVGPKNVRVQVVDGEVKLQGGEHDGDHLTTGQGRSLAGNDADLDSLRDLSTIGDVSRRRDVEQQQRFTEWKSYSLDLRQDKRLLAYYPIAELDAERFVSNEASSGNELNGALVGLVNHGDGRFGSQSRSLGFDRPGSRIRTRIDGEFDAFTFAAWVEIDSLDHLYNSLFMGDGYENGEPHWQIQHDGRMMFSVMVDDTPGSGLGTLPDARLHQIYYTDPIWDVSKSGHWMHVAAVYDPAARVVTQYVNGKQVSSEAIQEKFYVQKLRIGPAEIGNWGQPFRNSQEFAVRNLNGAIDELAIFGAALQSDEIKTLYENGKPFGY